MLVGIMRGAGLQVLSDPGQADLDELTDEIVASVRAVTLLAPGRAVGYLKHMRLHIALDDELVAEMDRRVGPRHRSAFIAELIRRGLEDERRWDDIESALGSLAATGHAWDDDPADWVRAQRRGDSRRAG